MNLTISTTAQAAETAGALIVRPVAPAELQEGAGPAQLGAGDPLAVDAVRESLRRSYRLGAFKAAAEQSLTMPLLGLHEAEAAVFVGLGEALATGDGLRRFGAAAVRELKAQKAERAVLLVPPALHGGTDGFGTAQAAAALAEGLTLGGYERSKTRAGEPLAARELRIELQLCGGAGEDRAAAWDEGVEHGRLAGETVAWARDLVHLPGSVLTPEALAEEAERLADEAELDVEIIDEWTAAELGMGGLLAVGKGSIHPPRMIVLHYEGDPDSTEKWGLIGKGITFDTGGYSLKRGLGMEDMIGDMGGAAAVLGAMRIIGKLKPKANVVAVIPSAENMISDRAFKPGDVLTMMNGMTVEIVNTDAEGRLVLADGLTTAIRRGATKLVDVATLTGAVVSALGDAASGVLGNDDTLRRELEEAAIRAGERVWPLPAYADYRRKLDSAAADLKNGAGREGAASIAGLFVGAFAEEKPWVHVDIAGTSWIGRPRGWESKGATGVMTRTLAELVLQDGGRGLR
ncbi:leucyl aminopeptidase [Paenibacillus albicereus]|uniref:Probable cytosol aminopeptidase n=2 Tax=Paenibacillus albicereus TaxID=2726185 RepID=A0A6H2H4H7_9BACL|nr:leucyl aminopeptidase [Paenibacillus albicereus]